MPDFSKLMVPILQAHPQKIRDNIILLTHTSNYNSICLLLHLSFEEPDTDFPSSILEILSDIVPIKSISIRSATKNSWRLPDEESWLYIEIYLLNGGNLPHVNAQLMKEVKRNILKGNSNNIRIERMSSMLGEWHEK